LRSIGLRFRVVAGAALLAAAAPGIEPMHNGQSPQDSRFAMTMARLRFNP
jgi:hypothetical protein